MLRVSGPPDLFLKSRPTRGRFVPRLSSNLETDLERLLGYLLLEDSAGVDSVDPEEAIRLPVTGDSLGQVPSQTAAHLVELGRSVEIPVFRPSVALRKEEIVRRARRIGTFELSIRTGEMCEPSEGSRAATRASSSEITRAAVLLPAGPTDEAVQSLHCIDPLNWASGMPIGRER
jgi:adenylyl- and sulfurtransferase ThiI